MACIPCNASHSLAISKRQVGRLLVIYAFKETYSTRWLRIMECFILIIKGSNPSDQFALFIF